MLFRSPKPVVGITNSVYSSETIEAAEISQRILQAHQEGQSRLAFFRLFDEADNDSLRLHLSLEAFSHALDSRKVIKKCLISENPQAAAKVSLLQGNVLQAFEFTLQAYIKAGLLPNDILDAFIFYVHAPPKASEDQGDQAEVKRQLLEIGRAHV